MPRRSYSKKDIEEGTPFLKLRLKHGLKQEELAEKLSKYTQMDHGRVGRIENGTSKTIYYEEYQAYMNVFHVSADYLLGFSEDEKGFDADLISCSEYLGLSMKAVETIKSNKNQKGKFILDLLLNFSHLYKSLSLIYEILRHGIYNRMRGDTDDIYKYYYKGLVHDMTDNLIQDIASPDIDGLIDFSLYYDNEHDTHIGHDLIHYDFFADKQTKKQLRDKLIPRI